MTIADCFALVGLLLIASGCWMVWHPLALLFCGVACLSLARAANRRRQLAKKGSN
jgi:hypothetical protein